jgi:hypothetical protein
LLIKKICNTLLQLTVSVAVIEKSETLINDFYEYYAFEINEL